MAKAEDLRAIDGEKQRDSPTVPGCHWVRLIESPVSRALVVTICGGAGLFFISWSDPGQGGKSL